MTNRTGGYPASQSPASADGRADPATPHLIDGEFQSDKYPTTPRGKVPLSVKDKTAQDLLWEYAQRRRSVDAQFGDDLETALKNAGYIPSYKIPDQIPSADARVSVPDGEHSSDVVIRLADYDSLSRAVHAYDQWREAGLTKIDAMIKAMLAASPSPAQGVSRDAVIEECARVCIALAESGDVGTLTALKCADDIRRLKSTPSIPEPEGDDVFQLIEGEFYQTRAGEVIGPLKAQRSKPYPWFIEGWGSFDQNGRFNGRYDDKRDLLALRRSRPSPAPMKLHFTSEWLREKIMSDPDDASYEAGSSHPDAPKLRFFIDHGVIHDRASGKHIRFDDSMVPHEDGLEQACALLNNFATLSPPFNVSRLASIIDGVVGWEVNDAEKSPRISIAYRIAEAISDAHTTSPAPKDETK